MKPSAIIATARKRTGDNVEPYLVSDDDHLQALNEAQDEAAERADLLYDDASAFLVLPMVDNVGAYQIDPRILKIDHATLVLAGSTRPFNLELTGVDDLEEHRERMRCGARPLKVAHIKQALHVWPVPRNANGGTIMLSVYRRPLAPIAASDLDDESAIELAPQHHIGLVSWLEYRACAIKDGEAFDPQRSAMALAEFTARFGERETEDVKRRRNERRRVTSTYGGL